MPAVLFLQYTNKRSGRIVLTDVTHSQQKWGSAKATCSTGLGVQRCAAQ